MHPSETHCHHYFDAFSHFCTLFDAWGFKWELWGASIRRWMCEYVCVENVRMCIFPNHEHCVSVWLNQCTRVALKIAPFPKVFILRVILCKCHKQDTVLVHRNTPIYTGKLHSFEIKHTRDLTQHRKAPVARRIKSELDIVRTPAAAAGEQKHRAGEELPFGYLAQWRSAPTLRHSSIMKLQSTNTDSDILISACWWGVPPEGWLILHQPAEIRWIFHIGERNWCR